jgi:hypothetical protein
MPPRGASSGVLGILAQPMPMTYSIDLARNIFNAGKPEDAAAVLHPAWLDLIVGHARLVAMIPARSRPPTRPSPSLNPSQDGRGAPFVVGRPRRSHTTASSEHLAKTS